MLKIAFAGNPNVGKSALINAISGSNLKVGNWPGVTVEKKEAQFEYKGETIQLIDLPGVYSLSPYTMEEKITREYILEENPDVVINVVESTNLERNLYLTMLLKELGKPMVMALNFYDEFEKLGYKLKLGEFSKLIEIEAIPTSASKKEGLVELLEAAISAAKEKRDTHHEKYELSFDNYIENTIECVKKNLRENPEFQKVYETYPEDYVAIKLLERDPLFREKLAKKYGIEVHSEIVETSIKDLEEKYEEDTETVFAESRYGAVKGILARTFTSSLKSRLDVTDKIDKVLLNKFLGLPIFFLIIAAFLTLVFNGSAPLIDWLDGFINEYLAKYIGMLVEGTPDWLNSLIVDGILGGVGGVVVFVPLMLFLYFFLALLEESGYMARVAFLMDKIMRKLGLNGKAFVPMVMGFGCNVPAIYGTRTLEDEQSRKLTALMVPFISCGARLPVYGLFTAAFFGARGGVVVLSLYLLGIVVAIFTGLIFKNFDAFRPTERALLIELPPYRIPGIKMVLRSTFERTGEYLKKATTVIMGILILLWALTYFPNHGDTSKSYMASLGRVLTPIMKPTGFADRWETVAAIPPSIAAKEIVVGFMAQVLTEQEEPEEAAGEEEEVSFLDDTVDQVVGLGEAIVDSVKGMLSFDLAAMFEMPDEDEVEEEGVGVVNATAKLWEGDPLANLRAYSFMVFILLVVPCVVTLAAAKQEFGTKFMLFMIGYMLLVPYVLSTLIFQIGRLMV
jgi:ferrous iron transport protein B